jgi:Cof subfamily protein (haloacid dehalogenase superfamily)
LAIKLIGIDVDGTLLDSRGQVPEANLRAVEAAAARGIHIVIVTGRSFFFALPAVAALPEPLTLVVHNGAIARTRSGDTLLRRLLPRQVAVDVLVATEAWRDSAVAIFDRPLARQMVYDRMDWDHPNRSRFRERNREIIERVESLEAAIVEDPIQIAFNGGVDRMRALIAELESNVSSQDLSILLTEYPARDFSLVDVCAAGITKGNGLAEVAALFGVERSDVMAVGDNYNDCDMLEWAGVGVVMGNAVADLRRSGFELTGTNDNAGLAAAIERFAL